MNITSLSGQFFGATRVVAFLCCVTSSSVFGAAQVTSVSVTNGLTINPGQSFTVSIVLARVGTAPNPMFVTYTLLDSSGAVYQNLGTVSFTTTGTKTVSVTGNGPFFGTPTGWRVRAVETTQSQAAATSNTFSVSQGAPSIVFYGVSGVANSDALILARTSNATADTSDFNTTDTVYFQVRPANLGEATQKGMYLRTLIDGQNAFDDFALEDLEGESIYVNPFRGGMPNLAPGSHTFEAQLIGGSNFPVNQLIQQTFNVASRIDLTTFQPGGYSAKVVVANGLGNTTGATTFGESENLYVSFGYTNAGLTAAGAFQLTLYVDGVQKGNTLASTGLAPNGTGTFTNLSIGSLPAGSHQVRVVVDSGDAVVESNEGNNSTTVTILTTGPKIVLEQPLGTPLTDAVSTITFASTTLGASTNISFAVKNPGTAPLLLNPASVTFTGSQSGDFAVVSLTPTTVVVNGTAILVIRFTPAVKGSCSVVMHLPSNVIGSTNPFEVNLAGNGISQQDTWRQTYYPGSTATSGSGADTATPQNDGIPNLLKFATFMDPTKAGVSPGVIALQQGAPTMALTFTQSKNALADGISFVVEWSDTLSAASWSSAGVTYSISDMGGPTREVVATIPLGPNGLRFARLRVATPNP